jgi:hypothetical protein
MPWLEHREGCRDVVRLDCRHCLRSGRYRLAVLIERYGPAAGLPEVLSADCPRRQDWRFHGPYGAVFRDLMTRPPA